MSQKIKLMTLEEREEFHKKMKKIKEQKKKSAENLKNGRRTYGEIRVLRGQRVEK